MGREKTQFKKGLSGNPSGRPKRDPFISAVKETTYKEFITALHKYGNLTRKEIAQELARPNATMFEVMFGQIVASAARGDKEARQVLLERLWGKVKEHLEIETSPLKDAMKRKSTEELLEIIKTAKADE